MQEHPERYTEEEIRQLMADEDCRLMYEQMVRGADAVFAEREVAEPHELPSALELNMNRGLSARYKIAAMFFGVLLLSGMAYAAIKIVKSYTKTGEVATTTTEAPVQKTQVPDSLLTIADEQPSDSIDMQPVVFEGTELSTMLNEIATFHHCEVIFKHEATKRMRLYFTWDKTATIDDVIATFNQFERLHITREDKKLIVE